MRPDNEEVLKLLREQLRETVIPWVSEEMVRLEKRIEELETRTESITPNVAEYLREISVRTRAQLDHSHDFIAESRATLRIVQRHLQPEPGDPENGEAPAERATGQ